MTINFIACGLNVFKWLDFEQKLSHLGVSDHLKQESTSKYGWLCIILCRPVESIIWSSLKISKDNCDGFFFFSSTCFIFFSFVFLSVIMFLCCHNQNLIVDDEKSSKHQEKKEQILKEMGCAKAICVPRRSSYRKKKSRGQRGENELCYFWCVTY